MRIDSAGDLQAPYRHTPTGVVPEFINAQILDCKPIEPQGILVGTNSSGKTALLQALQVATNSSGKSAVFQALQMAMVATRFADHWDLRKVHRAFQEIVEAPRRLRWSMGEPAWLSAEPEVRPHDHSDREAMPSIRSGLISGGYEFARYDDEDYSSEQLASLEAAWRAVAALALLYLASLLGVQPIPAGRVPVHRANAPCGVARLAATTVPRAPGVGFATSPTPTPCPA
ncbi:hypothetical protein [Streptomyces hydrogenans]|uniref:hypothetical protein n=1 Tax=Streptomyces hydrogenans TaxID=1873719 RepID=UPI0035DDDB09